MARRAAGGLGEMPLTLWVLVAAVVLYLYIRRARLGIDRHPGEQKVGAADKEIRRPPEVRIEPYAAPLPPLQIPKGFPVLPPVTRDEIFRVK